MKHTYSNPRLALRVDNYPLGGNRRGIAYFAVTLGRNKNQQRAERQTLNPVTENLSMPKVTTYAQATRIVTGDDNRTYILRDCGSHFDITQSNLKFSEETVFPGHEGYEDLRALITKEIHE